MEFVKKPIPVNAIRWEGNNLDDVKKWMREMGAPEDTAVFVGMTETLFQNLVDDPAKEVTAALWVSANLDWLGIVDGEWIMHDSQGFYPCKSEPDGSAPMNYGPVNPHMITVPPDPLRDLLAKEATSSMQQAEKALPAGIEVPDGQQSPFFEETPQQRGDRHADKLLNDVFVVEKKDLEDFSPATSHLHTCARTERSDNPCDGKCIHYLYSSYEDFVREIPAWVFPLVKWSQEEVDILDFNKVEVPKRLQGLLGFLPDYPKEKNDGAQ